jgi:carboxymethylenebutenolidase
LILALAACASIAHAQDYAARMHAMHAGDRPTANASAIPPRVDVTTETVPYGAGATGYLAYPAGAAKSLPGVVMIHEWWGLNDNMRMTARRLAGEGYTVLAVDLYGGKVATTPDEAQPLVRGVMQNPPGALTNLSAAVSYLHRRGAKKVGVIGWCFGGAWSIQTALFDADGVDADVAYYGDPELDRATLARLKAPFLGLYGSADQGIPVASVREMQAALDSLHKTVAITIYDGAQHAFANPSGPRYNKTAADDAWQRTTAFFAKYLKG